MAGYATTLRNAQQNQITAAIDAGAGPGILHTYAGTKPPTGGTAGSPVSSHTFSNVSGTVADGVWTAAPIGSAQATADVNITWARITDSDGNFVMDLTVGVDLILDNVSATTGLDVNINSCVITRGNL